jgi:hypothetical protein
MTEDLEALAEIQALILAARRLAAVTRDPHQRELCLVFAGAVEQRARELDKGCTADLHSLRAKPSEKRSES